MGITVVPRVYGNPRAITERKYYDTEFTGNIAATTTTFAGAEVNPATVSCLSAPAQGDDYNNRIGRKITAVAIKIKGEVFLEAQTGQAGAEGPITVRLILGIDTQTNATQVVSEDVINSGTALATLMFQNPANFGRYRILKDKLITLNPSTIAYDTVGNNYELGGNKRMFKINYKFRKPLVIRFNATSTAGVSSVTDNNIFMICGANSTSSVPKLSYKARFVYTDK